MYPFAEKYEGEGIFLNSNINPFGPSPLALRRIAEALEKVSLYPSDIYDILREKIAEKLLKEGLLAGVNRDEIVLCNGSDEAIELVFKFARLFFGRVPYIVVGEGTFAFYEYCAGYMGYPVIRVGLDNKYSYSIQQILDVAKKYRPAVLCISHPINPTGTIISASDYLSFISELPDDVFLISDEAYFEFASFMNGKLGRPSDYSGAFQLARSEKIFVTRTFSKVYGLAGLRLGYLITLFARDINVKIRQPFNVNYLAVEGAIGALEDHDHVKKTLENNLRGMSILEDFFRENNIPFVVSWGNFIFILIVPPLNKDRVYSELKKNRVFVRDMEGYGWKDALRVSIGKVENVKEFVSIMKKILKN